MSSPRTPSTTDESTQAQPSAARRPDVPPQQRPVIVGVDDSVGSVAAIEWAATEARARNVGLHIIHAWTWQMLEPWAHGMDRGIMADLKRKSQAVLEKSVALAHRVDDVTVTAESLEGYPPDVLAAQAENASLIVVGSHHLHAFGRAILGSVSGSLAARAMCPVVVLPGAGDPPFQNPAIVVGVTGSKDDERVLRFAFEFASRHGRPLRALFFWHPPLADKTQPPPESAQAWLSEALAGWREQFPDVDLHSAVVRDHPITGLVAAGQGQELLVVGRHSRRLRLGGLLGSVSLGVLHHATCAVAVVPPGD